MTKVQSLAKRICEGSAENPQGFPLGAQNFRGSTELADAGQLRRQCPANSSLAGQTLGAPSHQNEYIVLTLTLTPMIIIWTRYGVQTAMITAIILRKKVAPFIHYPASKTSIAARLLGRGR